jgi:adenosylcobyric acid synthase
VRFAAAREARIEGLADLAEKYLDVDALARLARDGAPGAFPVLAPGGAR